MAVAKPDFVTRYVNLASPRMGAEAVRVSDEFFAPAARMLADAEPVFIADKFDDHGKWMDGWETRRRRDGGTDWCLIRLGAASVVAGIDIDTRHFTGNFPPAASIEACLSDREPGDDADWTEIVAPTTLRPDSHHFLAIETDRAVNWLRLHLYPDGGVARLRVYGQPHRDWADADRSAAHELSALLNGGRVVSFNDAHYGNPQVVLAPGRGKDMGDGWETRRRREPGNDWMIIELGAPGTVERIEVDTAHFKGNFPDSCSLQAAFVEKATDRSLVTQAMFWPELMAPRKLSADAIHSFEGGDLTELGPVSHVRLNIYPDGGISRVRLFGRLKGE